MGINLPIEVYEALEKKIGKEEAIEIGKIIENVYSSIEEKAKDVALQKKLELKDELTKELATKADLLTVKAELRAEITELKSEIARLEGKIESEIARLEGKIESEIARVEGKINSLNAKLNFLIILMIIALTLMNPVVAELIKKLFF